MPLYHSRDLLAFYRHAGQQLLTVVDLETTGRVDPRHRAIEISVLQGSLQDGIRQQQTTLINPSIGIPPSITAFTGISQTMVDSAPPAEHVWLDYAPYLNEGILTAHNLYFDYTFIQLEYKRLGRSFTRPETAQLCTVALARLMLNDLPSRSLPALVRHYNLEVGPAHRAESDTLACWLVAQRLLTDIQNESDTVLLNRFGQQWIPLKIAAGILGCSQKQARAQLKKDDTPYKVSRGGNYLYRRRAVEQLCQSQQPAQQLTLL